MFKYYAFDNVKTKHPSNDFISMSVSFAIVNVRSRAITYQSGFYQKKRISRIYVNIKRLIAKNWLAKLFGLAKIFKFVSHLSF